MLPANRSRLETQILELLETLEQLKLLNERADEIASLI